VTWRRYLVGLLVLSLFELLLKENVKKLSNIIQNMDLVLVVFPW
jgi:hypothetical protein